MLCRMVIRAFGLRVAPILLSAAMLVGCAVAVDPNSSPAQQRMAQASHQFNNTVATGAAAGALTGLVVGLASGKWQNALIGMGVGAVTGSVAGYVVAQNNYAHAQTQENLNAAIQDAAQGAQDARNDAADAKQIADEARTHAAGLAQAVQERRMTAAQYRSQLSSYNQSLKAMELISSGLAKKSDDIHKSATIAGDSGVQLAASADEIDKSRAEIDQAADQIRQALAATPSA